MIKKFKNFQKNATIFHGLNGSPSPDKADLVEKFGYSVFYPHIDFELEWKLDLGKSMFKKYSLACQDSNLIIGFSLGGYLASLIANYLNINCILINPALDRKNTKTNIGYFDCIHKMNNCPMEIYLGDHDVVVPNIITLDYLKNNSINSKIHIINNMPHRCDVNNFEQILNRSLLI